MYLHRNTASIGLPPSPPSASSSIGIIDDGPYSGNNGRATKPEGVDVPKRRQKYGLSGGMIAIVVLSAFVAVILCSAAAWVLLFKYKSHACQAEEVPQSLQTSHVKPSGSYYFYSRVQFFQLVLTGSSIS